MKGLPVDQEQLVWRWTVLRAAGLRATTTAGNAAKLTEKELPSTPLDPPCSYNLGAVSFGVGLPLNELSSATRTGSGKYSPQSATSTLQLY